MHYDTEQKELDYLHKSAAKELKDTHEKLTVWAGGDAPHQQDPLIRAFAKRFPDVPLDLTVDLSKYHDIKIYQQLLDGHLTPDIAMLHTLRQKLQKTFGPIHGKSPLADPTLLRLLT